MDRNPLRILDCKKESCREVTEDAPSVYESLCSECREHFDAVRSSLDGLGAVYRMDKRLVRGLDYYTKTAYEVLSGALGSQNAVCGGGRYDNLAEAIGVPMSPAWVLPPEWTVFSWSWSRKGVLSEKSPGLTCSASLWIPAREPAFFPWWII